MTLRHVGRGGAALLLAMVVHGSLGAQVPTGMVRGQVTDAASNRGVGDVQVTVTGTRIGAVTNAQGEYTLTLVPTGQRSISTRRLGFNPMSQDVNVLAGQSVTANFAINVSAVNLNEVVVTGSGTPTEKRKIGTSIAAVDSAVIGRAQAVTVDQALQGKLPGAQITQNSGGPGGGGTSSPALSQGRGQEAVNVSSWAIANPIPAIVFFILLTFAGLASFKLNGVQDFPDIELPFVTVRLCVPIAALLE